MPEPGSSHNGTPAHEMNASDPQDEFVSVFDLIRIGIGPSSSHTVGPMRAARSFVLAQQSAGTLSKISAIRAEFFGSLASTGRGHAIEGASLVGLEGGEPRSTPSGSMQSTLERVRGTKTLSLIGLHEVSFDPSADFIFHMGESLPAHPNGMRFSAFGKSGETLGTLECYSVGGGRIQDGRGFEIDPSPSSDRAVPYPFRSARDLLELCDRFELSIAELMMANECVFRARCDVYQKVLELWIEMKACADHGLRAAGTLPGTLGVKRRAKGLYRALYDLPPGDTRTPHFIDWINAIAIAIGEENAAGSRVVTAPTNGAAALMPAVLHYYERFCDGDSAGIIRFFLTAAAIGSLFRRNASISGAEVGCQGEIGVAASMSAGGLAAALGADARQIEKAAEIAMEHYLGLTCDPIAGLVQIPCIERNAMGAHQAINAQRLAMSGPIEHVVSLDAVIEAMRQTGRDMRAEYKETAAGGLAVIVNQC